MKLRMNEQRSTLVASMALVAVLIPKHTASFTTTTRFVHPQIVNPQHSKTSLNEKILLTEDGGVQKEILFHGRDAEDGDEPVYSYMGSLGVADWSPQEVVDCWLSEQQGLDNLEAKFLEKEIGETILTTPELFTENYVANELGVEGKIPAKKLVLASKRLSDARTAMPPGHVFDSNSEYKPSEKKLIQGMELGFKSMKPGEWSLISVRSDYAYGSEGLRLASGDVVVPPYATLVFEVQWLIDSNDEDGDTEEFVELPEST
jgi:hypothetical protein